MRKVQLVTVAAVVAVALVVGVLARRMVGPPEPIASAVTSATAVAPVAAPSPKIVAFTRWVAENGGKLSQLPDVRTPSNAGAKQCYPDGWCDASILLGDGGRNGSYSADYFGKEPQAWKVDLIMVEGAGDLHCEGIGMTQAREWRYDKLFKRHCVSPTGHALIEISASDLNLRIMSNRYVELKPHMAEELTVETAGYDYNVKRVTAP